MHSTFPLATRAMANRRRNRNTPQTPSKFRQCCVHAGVLVSFSVVVACAILGFSDIFRYNGALYVGIVALVALVFFVSLCIVQSKDSYGVRAIRQAFSRDSNANSTCKYHVPCTSDGASKREQRSSLRRLTSLLRRKEDLSLTIASTEAQPH